jgi:hypothetical protein
MPSESEIDAAVQAMIEEDPIVMRMLTPQEARELAAAALRGGEAARAVAAEDEPRPRPR